MVIFCCACGTAHQISADAAPGDATDGDIDSEMDALVSGDAETTREDQHPAARCECPEPNAEIVGSAPTGPAQFHYAFLGDTFWEGLDCWDLRMLFSFEQTVEGPWFHDIDIEGLVIFIRSSSDVEVVAGRRLPVDVALNGTERHVAQGTILFEELDEDLLAASGTLEIRDEGWEIEGDFDAVHCPLLDDACL